MSSIGGCSAAKKHFDLSVNCCISCHDDFDQGYDSPTEINKEGDFALTGQPFFEVCCRVVDAISSKQPTASQPKGEMK